MSFFIASTSLRLGWTLGCDVNSPWQRSHFKDPWADFENRFMSTNQEEEVVKFSDHASWTFMSKIGQVKTNNHLWARKVRGFFAAFHLQGFTRDRYNVYSCRYLWNKRLSACKNSNLQVLMTCQGSSSHSEKNLSTGAKSPALDYTVRVKVDLQKKHRQPSQRIKKVSCEFLRIWTIIYPCLHFPQNLQDLTGKGN